MFDGKADYFAVRCVAEVPIKRIVRHLFLAIPNWFSHFGPMPSTVIMGAQNEEIVKFAERSADPAIIVSLAPIGKSLLR